MDARGFLAKKHDAAVEELHLLDAEYNAKKQAAQAMIDLTKKWMDELGPEKTVSNSFDSVQDVLKGPSESWVSARDLNPKARQVA